MLSFVSADRIASFKGEADVEPLVPAATGTFDLSKFSLGLLFPYYKDVLAVDVQKGSLDLRGHFALLPDGNVKLSEAWPRSPTSRSPTPVIAQPFWSLPIIAADGVDLDLAMRSVKVGATAEPRRR